MSGAIRPFRDEDLAAVVALWRVSNLTVPHNDPVQDIAFCRRSGHGEVLLGEEDGTIVASVMVGHDGHRGWVYYVAVEPSRRGAGWGRRIMDAAEAWLRSRGVRKMEFMIRNSNIAVREFYAHLGYKEEPVAVMSRWLDGTRVRP
ncbi:MAG: GNAT family acetyltransferase [Alphaproteobacteria bacterium]